MVEHERDPELEPDRQSSASEQQARMESGEEVKSAAWSAAVFEGQQPLFTESDPFEADEEFAAEIAAPVNERNHAGTMDQKDTAAAGKTMMGWFALALAIASLFVWPAILGPGAVLFGYIAWSQGSRALGVWSIVLGIISFVAFLAVAPLFG